MTAEDPRSVISLADDPALAQVLAFAQHFGPEHLVLAMHAAVPLGLTPELLHLLRINLLRKEAPAIAEANLLLSPLCQDTGGGFYQMSPEIRELLLDELRSDPEYGVRRRGIRTVAEFLYAHAEKALPLSHDAEERAFLMAQQWTALAYLEPKKAADSLATELARSLVPAKESRSHDILRVARVAQALTAPLLGEERLLLYLAAIERSFTGNRATAARIFDLLQTRDRKFEFRKDLHLPSGREILAAALPPTFTNSIGMKFVLVRRGTFWMSKDGKNAQRQVEISHDFFMGVHPVTQEQWQAVMGNNPSYFSRTGGGKDRVKEISEADLRQFPAERVSWQDIQEYLTKLNQQKAESEWLYRLPTEAEWEYTCRGGALSEQDCSFDFYVGDTPSNDLSSEDANFNGIYPAGKAPKGPYLDRTSRVGSYKPNRLGIYDMHGNVWEWCQDLWAEGGSGRVFRGGGWDGYGSDCTAARRDGFAPGISGFDLGFRLARVRSGLWSQAARVRSWPGA